MNIQMKSNVFGPLGSLSLFNSGSKSSQEKLKRQEERDQKVAYFEKQKENLKNKECDSVEEIRRKLDQFYAYEDQITAAKNEYNQTQMMHAMDEAIERGEKIAEAKKKMEPKTAEERREEKLEELFGTKQEDKISAEIDVKEVEIPDESRTEIDNAFYKITKGENGEFSIYDKVTGQTYWFIEQYTSIQTDSATGISYLISDIPSADMNVTAMRLTPELEHAMMQFRNKEALPEKELDSKFTVTTDSTTGIQGIHWKCGDGYASAMIMSTAEQKKKFDDLVDLYLTKYPNLVSGQTEAEYRAAAEVMGNAKRTENGIITMTSNAVSYSDNNDPEKNWTYFTDFGSISMDEIDGMRNWLFSLEDAVLENEGEFMKALAQRQLENAMENSRVQMEMLESNSIISVKDPDSWGSEIRITWITEEGIFCRKAGQSQGYEWKILFTNQYQYQKALEYMEWAKDNVDDYQFAAQESFWRDLLRGNKTF